jgi:hypothetical protein
MEKNMKTRTKNNHNKIIYTTNNIFDSVSKIVDMENKPYVVLIPHVCNNINSFGAGFAAAVQQNYPIVKENYHLLGKKSQLGYTQFVTARTNKKTDSKLIFCNMIAQNGTISKLNHRPINYAALVKCMIDIKKAIDTLTLGNEHINVQIHAPKFGSGLAGGNWNFIENLIEDIWYNIPTYIYLLK